MTEVIIPPAAITLDASEKNITLSPPYNKLGVAQIIEIRNLKRNVLIYHHQDPKAHNAIGDAVDISSITNGFSYVETAGMADADPIKIIANIDEYSLSDSQDLFTGQSVAASASATCAASIFTGRLSKLGVYVANAGASTNVTVSIWGSPTSSLTGRKKLIVPFTLGAGNVTVYEAGNGIDPSQIPAYIWATITNSDAANAATITVTLEMFR